MVHKKIKSKLTKTEFKYVRSAFFYEDNRTKFAACMPKFKHYSVHEDIREAAKMVDTVLIKKGKEPVNILKCKV